MHGAKLAVMEWMDMSECVFPRCEAHGRIRSLPTAIINQPSLCLPPTLPRSLANLWAQLGSPHFGFGDETSENPRGVREGREERRGRIRLIFQLGIETANRRSRRRPCDCCLCLLSESGKIDARPCVTLRGKKSVDRSFVRSFLSLSLSNERTLGIFCQILESKRGAVGNISRRDEVARRRGVDPIESPFPPSFPLQKRNGWIIERSITAALIKYSIPFSLRILLLISLVFLRHRTCTNIFEHFLFFACPIFVPP